MRAALALGKGGQHLLSRYPVAVLAVVLVRCVVLGALCILAARGAGEAYLPSLLEYLPARGLETDAARLGQHCGLGKAAVGVEHGDEAPHDHVVDLRFVGQQGGGVLARGDDGVVVRDLAAVKDLLALSQFAAPQGLEKRGVTGEAVEYRAALGVDIVGEVGGVDARVGRDVLLIEALGYLQRPVGGQREPFVALHLQRREVEQARRRFAALLARYLAYHEVLALHL